MSWSTSRYGLKFDRLMSWVKKMLPGIFGGQMGMLCYVSKIIVAMKFLVILTLP